MKIQHALIFGTIFILGSCTSSATSEAAEVKALAERIEVCAHLAGEVGSGDAERESEVRDSLDNSDCDDEKIRQQIDATRKKYADYPDKLVQLNDAIESVRENYGVEY